MARSIWKGPFSDLKTIKSINSSHNVSLGAESISDKAYANKDNDKSTHGHPSPTQREKPPSTISQLIPKKSAIVTVWSRRSQILPTGVDKKFLVHNGRAFINVKCTQSMCSRKYGEFAVTRKKPSHKLNKRKQLHKSVR